MQCAWKIMKFDWEMQKCAKCRIRIRNRNQIN